MIFKNNKYEDIQIDQEMQIKEIIDSMISFISKYNFTNEELSYLRSKANLIPIIFADKGEFLTIYFNNKKKEIMPTNAAAFSCLVEQYKIEKGYICIPGVIFRKKDIIYSQLHNFVHEFFHALSMKKRLLFNKKNHVIAKNGVELSKWDINDKIVGEKLFTSIKEGMTEMLTIQLLNESELKSPYELQTIIAMLLTIYDKALIHAYFSEDNREVRDFFIRFNENQNIMDSNELGALPKFFIFDNKYVQKILKACIEYSMTMAITNNIEFNEVDIISIVSKLDNTQYRRFSNDLSFTEFTINTIDELKKSKILSN